MKKEEVLEKVLRSYAAYYDVDRSTAEAPFLAEAVFHSHNDAYFLVKNACIGEAESHEYVFFALADELDEAQLRSLDEAAWQSGLSRVKPHANHRNTDISLIVIADSVTKEAAKLTGSLKHYKSYRMSLQGFSHYHLIVADLSSGESYCNRQGRSLKKLFNKII